MLLRRLLKLIPVYLFLFGLPFSVGAQEGEVVLENALLWEVKGNGLPTSSYLFGTIHLLCKDEMQLPETVISKLRQSETIYFEVNLEQHTDSALYAFVQGRTLKELVGKRYYKQIKEKTATRFPYSDDTLNRLHPWVAAMMVTTSSLECETTSIEKLLEYQARRYGKPIKGLESYISHFTINGTLTLEQQAADLKAAIDQSNMAGIARIRSIGLYKNKDITAMYTSSAYRQGVRTPKSKHMLDERNQLWLPVIEAAMQQSTTFFAFGAAHLAGANGIIHLLRQQGYTITPVNY
jgi:uncharacterized protein YbaP (TraB family)